MAAASSVDSSLLEEPSGGSPAMLTGICDSSAPLPPPIKEEKSLMDELMAEAEVAQSKKAKEKAKTQATMKKCFGSGLKKGFLKEPKEIVVVPRKKDDVKTKISNEVRKALSAGDESPPWLTPDLLEKMKEKPTVRKFFEDPKYLPAIELLKRDPRKALEACQDNPELKEFVSEFCGLMGSHFEGISERKQTDPEVERVVNDPKLSKLLMDPQTQELMKRCSDPKEFVEAMRDPRHAATIQILKEAGLVRVEH